MKRRDWTLTDGESIVLWWLALAALVLGFTLLILHVSKRAGEYDRACIAKGGAPYHGRGGYLCLAPGVTLPLTE